MLRELKLATLDLLKGAGAFELVANSRWRRDRLLILCYHGISLDDEHLWRPFLYLNAAQLGNRLEALHNLDCSVLPLGEALSRLHARNLPPRSVALTFDDGTYDFYKQAYPLLKQHAFPVTVYQTTYYSDRALPVFNLMCSYLLWKRRERQGIDGREFGLSKSMDVRTELGRHRIVRGIIDFAERKNLNGEQKNEIAKRLAEILGIDYSALLEKRILQLMNQQEMAEVVANGVDLQLHTHRHRAPEEERLFRREIIENRERIRAVTGKEPAHFCYPSGVYRRQFFEWLQKENITSATTCDAGLATRKDARYLLPRLVDTTGRTQLEFDSWVSGVGAWLSLRRVTPQRYVVPKDRPE